LSLRIWMKLFGMTILIGGLVSLAVGVSMQLSDPEYRNIAADEWIYNMFQMLMSGFTFGAFAHMGFFAYLMVNYIARSIFRRPQLWVALQAFTVVFVLVEIVYWTYGSDFPAAFFWAMPLVMVAASLLVAWRKVKETTSGSWIPTLFFMICVTTLEGIPVFRTHDLKTFAFEMIPLFVCNAYQILVLHRILKPGNEKLDVAKAG